jgi:hypothetical protein
MTTKTNFDVPADRCSAKSRVKRKIMRLSSLRKSLRRSLESRHAQTNLTKRYVWNMCFWENFEGWIGNLKTIEFQYNIL